jgi:hypothetical protein
VNNYLQIGVNDRPIKLRIRVRLWRRIIRVWIGISVEISSIRCKIGLDNVYAFRLTGGPAREVGI